MNDSVVHAEATLLVGIPFVRGGRDFRRVHGGTDCLGVGVEFRRRIGRMIPDPWEQIERLGPDAAAAEALACYHLCGERKLGACAVHGERVYWYAGGGWALTADHAAGTRLVPVRSIHPQASMWWDR